ncbi:hypothetical protein FPRO05_14221 [Fusarium proliferatum]|uniref:Acriflavine sensitivity control protein acr-2 n=1 Tax=Gibberella intermedia TaxID=948311 RepID=A0A365MTJ5_GIBIN|nr:hypothetical protein FPRO05_14221 [Fusarium proliferatum]
MPQVRGLGAGVSRGNVNPLPKRRFHDDADAASGSASAHCGLSSGYQTGQGHSHGRPQLQPQTDYSDQQQQRPQDDETSTSSSGANIPWPSPAALTDSLFQDLDRTSRYYLAHFSERVCKDLVVRDTLESNPFRELIPLTRKHPLLLQILVATSAIHWSNIFCPVNEIPADLISPAGYLSMLRSRHLTAQQALIDALTAKQKAMNHLRELLDTLDPTDSEVALVAMNFFIKFDLIDLDKLGNQSWRAQLEGATSIMTLLNPDSNTDASSRMLRDRVITDSSILVEDIDSRVHLAAAHRSAGCPYILQALPVVRSMRSIDTDLLLGDVLSHLAAIDENDPYFKASSWPTFIAGAETRDPEKRTWILTRLLSIWEVCPWGYLFTAVEILKATWAMQDTRGSENVNWLHDLRGMGFGNLIV